MPLKQASMGEAVDDVSPHTLDVSVNSCPRNSTASPETLDGEP